jgi:predicted amidohydrolase YtcJ
LTPWLSPWFFVVSSPNPGGPPGKLEPGILADFVVLDRDLTSVLPPKVLEKKVLRTVVGGKTIYEAN